MLIIRINILGKSAIIRLSTIHTNKQNKKYGEFFEKSIKFNILITIYRYNYKL